MKEKLANGVGSQYPSLPRNMVYPALVPLMRTPRLPVVTELTPLPIYMGSSVTQEDEIWFLRMCHHVSTGL